MPAHLSIFLRYISHRCILISKYTGVVSVSYLSIEERLINVDITLTNVWLSTNHHDEI